MKAFLRVALASMFAVGLAAGVGYTKLLARAEQNIPAAEQTVTIDNFSFTPREITVTAGTKVTWINRDDVPHTVVGNKKEFGSKALDTDDRFSFTFDKPGTYEYFCSVHPMMTAKVIVKP